MGVAGAARVCNAPTHRMEDRRMRQMNPRKARIIAIGLVFLLPDGGRAQGMKIPGEATTQSNIVKPVLLEATTDRLAALRLASGLTIVKVAEGLQASRGIVVVADGSIYVSSRYAGR